MHGWSVERGALPPLAERLYAHHPALLADPRPREQDAGRVYHGPGARHVHHCHCQRRREQARRLPATATTAPAAHSPGSNFQAWQIEDLC